jgi:hypothetical protein
MHRSITPITAPALAAATFPPAADANASGTIAFHRNDPQGGEIAVWAPIGSPGHRPGDLITGSTDDFPKGRGGRRGTISTRRACARAAASLSLLLVLAAAGCGGSNNSSTAAAAQAAGNPSSSSDPKPASIVGEWQRVTTCADLVRALEQAGFDEMAPGAAAGNGFIPGVTTEEDLADPSHPCKGAIPRRHSHFFTSDGQFGSRDWNGNQVDEGTYEIIDDNTLVIAYGFEDGPPIYTTFHYRIAGETISFDPVMPNDCSTSRCREVAAWSVTVALPGKRWRRVS